ncbi:MAG: sigma-54-dependent transcriptional regulator [Bdellovibrionia bacterium]
MKPILFPHREDEPLFSSKSQAMITVYHRIAELRHQALNEHQPEPLVFIESPLGAPHESLARMIHQGSRRAEQPFIALNCALLESDGDFERTLFGTEQVTPNGHQIERGLFEAASGGTIFLEHVEKLPLSIQKQLERALEGQSFQRIGGLSRIPMNLRMITQSPMDLSTQVQQGQFLGGLYHRLCSVSLILPALCEKKEDLLPLAHFYGNLAFQALGKPFSGFSPEAEQVILEYPWPGNELEMKSVFQRVSLLQSGKTPLPPHGLGLPTLTLLSPTSSSLEQPPTRLPLAQRELEPLMQLKKQWSDSFERQYLTTLLEKTQGNVTHAAQKAGLDRSNFLRLLRKHQIKASAFRNPKVKNSTPAPTELNRAA